MEGARKLFWTICSTLVIITSIIDCHPVETKTHDELKSEIKGIKTEIQELFDRINELSSTKSDDDDSNKVDVYNDADDFRGYQHHISFFELHRYNRNNYYVTLINLIRGDKI